jgi:hypothetical protein
MEKYNIGQMLELNQDVEAETLITKTKKIRKKGTKLFVTASKKPVMAAYLNGDMEVLDPSTIIEGFSVNGISEWLYIWLRNKYPLEEWLDDYEIERDEFKEELADALEELGMYDNTGNRS